MKIGNRVLKPKIAVSLVVGLLLIFSFIVFSFVKEKYHYLREHIDKIEEIVNYNAEKNVKHYNFDYSWADKQVYISHGMGEINGDGYTNSLQAFEYNYGLGHRIFEVDFDLSSDHYLICSHDEEYWRQITQSSDDVEYSFENFNNTKVCGNLDSLNYMDIVDLLNQYDDVYIVTDTKYTDEYRIRMQFTQLVDYAKQVNEEVLDRIIPQIYHEKMLDYIMQIYEFKSVIYTMYQLPEVELEDITSFCSRSGIKMVTMAKNVAEDFRIKQLSRFGIRTAVHTIDDENEAKTYLDAGVTNIYTNVLYPINSSTDSNTAQIENYKITGMKDGYLFYSGGTYRYGPSILRNDDGSFDIWISSPGNNSTQWDYITYKHSEDGYNWSSEQIVLRPTPGTKDQCSVCDPGIIFFNGYYYLGYTATDYYEGKGFNNSIFVSRSQNPNGPFEKWNGEGWGGNPEPIIEYDGDKNSWGIGEPSFVIKDDKLYIYYTYDDGKVAYTKLAFADLSENWPSTIKYETDAFVRQGNDSLDVVYADGIDRFLAVSIKYRMNSSSQLILLASKDGKSFTEVDWTKDNFPEYSHNVGISKDKNGHIIWDDSQLIGYAYGATWGRWNAIIQKIGISYTVEEDIKTND